ncbi:hypothetical protein CLOM_g10120 [Closterium sp. NIES-68]|nr:hypothetical protein CLOM_g10120 [Closterium sp. NIES-68]GJP74438.1 hypothetical protein CLOP_g5018 [Closterium sp. NIES-67]
MASVSLALDCRAVLGESPVCNARGDVWFVDINGRKILGYDSVASRAIREEAIATPQLVGCVAPRASGGLIAAMEDCIVAVDTSDGWVTDTLLQMPSQYIGPKIRFNDGKCDPSGRFWAGTMHASWRDPSAPAGHLFCFSPAAAAAPGAGAAGAGEAGQGEGLGVEVKVEGTQLSNGLAWSGDGSRLFFIDSALRTVDCFDYDAATAGISNRRTVVTFGQDEPGVPDGMAIDAGGHLWVVVGESGSVRQMDAETGKEITRVGLPVVRPTSCAFGGKDLSELYVTTREEPGTNPSANAGGLFKCLVPGVKGLSFADAFCG